MKILDDLVRPGAQVRWERGGDIEAVSTEVQNALTRAKRFEIDASLADHVLRLKTPSLEQIGPQILPFEECWFEYDVAGAPPVNRIGVFASMRQHKTYHGHRTISFTIHTSGLVPGVPFIFEVYPSIDVDERGSITGWATQQFDPDANSQSVSSQKQSWALASVLPAMYSVGLLNCKNVSVERIERLSRVTKKQRRARPPKLDYHTIILPNASIGGGSGDRLPGSGDVLPRHKVRGHFKRFTAEAPLMGKHVGTYWWGWQVRGNKKNGITVTDYKIGDVA